MDVNILILHYFKKTLLCGLLLFGLLLLCAALLLGNPHWLTPLIEKQLRQQGITAEISQVRAKLNGSDYQIAALLNGSSSDYGVTLKHAHITATLNWKQLWQQQPFIKKMALNDGSLTLDKRRLSRWQAAFKQLKKRPATSTDLSLYLPLDWSIQQGKIGMDNQQLTLDARGLQAKQIRLIAHDHDSGYLTIDYEQEKQTINLHSQQLNLAALTGYDAVLKDVDAVINTQNWADSRVSSRLIYQNIHSDIQLTGQDNQVELAAVVQGETIKGIIRYDDYGAQLRFAEVNVAALMGLKPLLPRAFADLQMSGVADGVMDYDYEQGIRLLAANLQQAAITHPNLITSRLSARIWLQNQQVKYHAAINDGTLLLPALFDQEQHRVSGKVNGMYQLPSQRLTIEHLALHSPDFQRLTATGTLQLANEPAIDIQAELHNAQLAKTARYLPKNMPPAARRWLAKAFVSGDKNHTTLTLKGVLSRLMSADESVFLVNSRLQNTVLHYLATNPNVHLKHADLVIDKRALSVVSDEATIGGLPLTVSADIEDLSQTTVEVAANIKQQSLTQMQAIAAKSIAKQAINKVKKTVKASGLFDLDLAINLPVAHADQADTFHIRLHSDNATMALQKYPALVFKKTATTVLVNEQGLQQITAKGNVNAQPVQLDLTAHADGYRVDAFLTAEASKVLPQLNLITPAELAVLKRFNLLSGKSRYKAGIDLAADGRLLQLDVSSALIGTQINLFDAVKKTGKQRNAMILSYSAKKQYFQLHIDKLLLLKVGLDNAGRLNGLVVDTNNKKRNYRSGMIQLYLKHQRLNATALNAFSNAYQKANKSPTPRKILPYQLLIDIQQLTFKGGKSYPLFIKGNRNNIQLNSPIIQGNIQQKGKQLNAQLARVEVDALFNLVKQTEVNPGGREIQTISLAKMLPQLDIDIEKVILKGKNLGTLHFETSIRDGLYSIEQALLSGNNYFIELAGHEAKEPQGITTYIQADFKGEGLAGVIRNFSLNEVIDAKNLDISANLAWPGKAHTLNVQRSYGKAHLNAQNLKLLNVSSGVGSVFGVMDVIGILKRISLDFKNLNSSKISFDTMQGSWNIGGGRAITRDYYADGSVVALKMQGAVDLHRRTFDDVKIYVIPRASNVLPIVGAVAGGVVGVAAGFVLQQVMGDSLDEAIGIPYEIIGSWENPKIQAVNSPKNKNSPKSHSPKQ